MSINLSLKGKEARKRETIDRTPQKERGKVATAPTVVEIVLLVPIVGKALPTRAYATPTRKALAPGGAQCNYSHEKERGRSPTFGGNGGTARNSAPSTPLVLVSSAMLVETGTGTPAVNLGTEATPPRGRGQEQRERQG